MVIVTHAGQAHLDEVIAISLLLTKIEDEDVEIKRVRKVTEKELNDRNIFVVDVGEKFQPELNNYDHHNNVMKDYCSYYLVGRYFLNLTDASDLLSWWDIRSDVDTDATTFAKSLKMETTDLLDITTSPIDQFFTKLFETNPNMLIPALKEFGYFILKDLENARNSYNTILHNYKILTYGENDGIDIGNSSTRSLNTFIHRLEKHPDFVMMDDNRGDGKAILRINNNLYDFHKVSKDDRVLFAHSAGFIMKLRSGVSTEDITDLLNLCRVGRG